MTQFRKSPLELWLYVLGFAVYIAAPFLPRESGFIPANPIAIFAVGMGVMLLLSPDRKRYWVALGFGLAAALYPASFLIWWIQDVEPGRAEIWAVLLTPLILLGLLASPRVRRFAAAGGASESRP